ncbi:4580_t:CDS:2 [Paraglomus occultum]|uniref:cystathionine gamma-synthase n=1 Tax=Paraglomus occultum TaxID=144539 RepID=A0A9N8W8G2_9GLOM|nr:4580_t:CDS:2 [Paraglomus occultum]
MIESSTELGCSIPANTPHAVSVALPKWQDNVDYEEGKERVLSRMVTGYPRFFIHKEIQKLISVCNRKFAKPEETCLLFPTRKAAQRCKEFLNSYYIPSAPATQMRPRLAEISVIPPKDDVSPTLSKLITLHVVLFPEDAFKIAKSFWQHSGEGISSRMAEYILWLMQTQQYGQSYLENGSGALSRRLSFKNRYSNPKVFCSSQLYEQSSTLEGHASLNQPTFEENRYVEERYGRNLHIAFADKAKVVLKRRIAGTMGVADKTEIDDLDHMVSSDLATSSTAERGVSDVTEDDVYLFSCGMNAIFHAHHYLLAAFPPRKSVCFGFTYTDSLKVLQKFGPGCFFFGNGSSEEIDELEKILEAGEKILGLFCEFPSNPLCKSPDLKRLRALADKYDFLMVIDETLGNFINVAVLEWADILVSSLTKVFSGDSNVMGGSMVLNPQRKYYHKLKDVIKAEYEDNLWEEDAIFLERNSRTFRERIAKIDENAEALCDFLNDHPKVKKVYYPKYITPDIYLQYKKAKGGYGGLFSLTFHTDLASEQFFDALPAAKGPSLGTNFTLACPYTILAHYVELDWAAQYGVEKGLVRVSVGLEDKDILLDNFAKALDAIKQ